MKPHSVGRKLFLRASCGNTATTDPVTPTSPPCSASLHLHHPQTTLLFQHHHTYKHNVHPRLLPRDPRDPLSSRRRYPSPPPPPPLARATPLTRNSVGKTRHLLSRQHHQHRALLPRRRTYPRCTDDPQANAPVAPRPAPRVVHHREVPRARAGVFEGG